VQNKVALVTGSTSGIGRGIAEHFAALGARVVIHGLEPDLAQRTVDGLGQRGFEAKSIVADLVDPAACRRVVQFAVEQYGGIDILVNNAATLTRGYLEDVPVDVWDAVIAVNLRAPFICLQEAVKTMKTRGGGSIVNIGSVNAYIGEPKLGPYSVSKGGLMTLTRNAASALGKYGIRVNQINPGWTLTEGERRIKQAEGKPDTWLDAAVATRPFGRLLSPHDVAMAAAYFASDASAMVSGAVLDLEQHPVGALPNL
jgi:NAD(P)-dependent dehydrogenase (short-subunit alcohol dehydrogenase family)